ncbi:unnamed protein product [Strongylus vulgaris]|uniref:Sugar phosphate transporter domain-containing protein n=1 Tax=Strongylus vulgaris TaxID=40348 RepID=A0A3P7KSZ8_STRVU|nr:unnamed protein product [Strongylus vulgaris]
MQREEQALSHPLDMVAHVQPWMLIPIIPLILMFEGSELSYDTVLFYKHHYAPVQNKITLLSQLQNLEYLLLVNTSGITLNIFGIVKATVQSKETFLFQEVATLLLAHLLNNDHLSAVNVAGLVLCLCGMTLHGMSRRRQR